MIPTNPISLSQEAIEEFKRIYFKESGIQLTNQQVIEIGSRLIRLVKAVYGSNLPRLKTLDTGTKK